MRPGQQELRGGEHAKAVLGFDRLGHHVLLDAGDLCFEVDSELGEGRSPFGQPDDCLLDDAG